MMATRGQQQRRIIVDALPPLLLVLLLQGQQLEALVARGIARVPIELGGVVHVSPAPSEQPLSAELAARGCVVGRWKGYSLNLPAFTQPAGDGEGHTLRAPAQLENATSLRCAMPPVLTAGNTTIVLDTANSTGSRCRGWPVCAGPHRFACNATQQGGYGCAWVEYFALFAPAFSRRPYISEDVGAIVVETDYSLAGQRLRLTATVGGGVVVQGSIDGGRRASLE